MTLAIIDGDVLIHMSMWKSFTLEAAQKKFEGLVDEMKGSIFASDYVMAIGGDDNFRKDLYFDYKGKRTKERPFYYKDLKHWAVESDDSCIMTDNYEADDQVRIWSLEAKAAGINSCVVTVDKDLDCITGTHYNPRTKEIYQVTQEWADYFYHLQLLMGDSVDNIPGIRGIGVEKAKVILEGLSDNEQYFEAVCKAYDKKYGKEGFGYLLLNAKLLHIWRTFEDHYTLDREVYDAAIKG